MPGGTHVSDAWHPPVGCITPLVTCDSPPVGFGGWRLDKHFVVSEETVRSICGGSDENEEGLGKKERLPQASGCVGPTCFAILPAVASQAQAIWEDRKGREGKGLRSERASEVPGRTIRDFSKEFQTLRRKL